MWGGGVDADEGMGARAHLEVPCLLANGRGSVDQGMDFVFSLVQRRSMLPSPPSACPAQDQKQESAALKTIHTLLPLSAGSSSSRRVPRSSPSTRSFPSAQYQVQAGERRAHHHPHAPPPLRRIKFKQESAALKAELQKFQLESKTGNKGMELATKEVDALK